MMNKTFLVLVVIVSSLFQARAQDALDTLETDEGTMVLYNDFTWKYLEDINFDGIMNPTLYEQLELDSTYSFSLPWNHDECYASKRSNDLMLLKDTLWLCAVDSGYEKFAIPHPGRVTSKYGWRRGRYHNGIDISLNTGDTVVAAFDGKVRYAKYNSGGFGRLVIIRHYNGLETFYAHLSKSLVVPNQHVKAGDPIALGGNSGRSYGAHLHFEVRFYDAPMDPEVLFDFNNQTLRSENLFLHSSLFIPGVTLKKLEAISANGGLPTYHRVKSGETLSAIARKYGTSVNAICRLNNIRSTSTLKINQVLQVF